ncbi:MAG: YopX family protein [Bacteroidota bacterium]|nr:YopX family protein [Bacteroidota bacterium]
MGEILFRGKRVDKDIFVEGDLIHGVGNKSGKMYILPIKENLAYLEGCHHLDGYEVIPETVGQRWIRSMKVFFGGDLFKAVSSISGSKQKKIHLCKVIDSEFGMDIAIWYKGEWWGYSYMNFIDIEMVGNIHDNPELLN